MELSEIKEISDIIFEKIERQIDILKTIEASVDQKIAILKKLKEGEDLPEKQPGKASRLSEIRSLRRKGLGIREIADVLKIPAGEVELIVNLDKDGSDDTAPGTHRQTEQKISLGRQFWQRRGSRLLSLRAMWGLSAIVLVTVVAVYLFLRQWDRVSLTPPPKSNNAVIQMPPVPPTPLPLPSSPAEENNPPDIDAIRKKYSPAAETESPKKTRPEREAHAPQTKPQPIISSPKGERDTTVTIFTDSATVRAEPDLRSSPVAWVSKGDILDVTEDFTDRSGKKWKKVVTPDGREGWIAESVAKPPS